MMSWTTVCISNSDTLAKRFMGVSYKYGKSVLIMDTFCKNNFKFVKMCTWHMHISSPPPSPRLHLRHHHHHNHNHQANMELSQFLTCSSLTGIEVSWLVSSGFFCLLIYSLLIFSEIYYGAFCFCIFRYSCNYSLWEKKCTAPIFKCWEFRSAFTQNEKLFTPKWAELLRMWVVSVNERQKRTISVNVSCQWELYFYSDSKTNKVAQ
jgi:hypothetical protein